MRHTNWLFALIASIGLVAAARAQGPDLIISDLPDILHYGPVGRLHAYSVGFVVCNQGDQNAAWVSNTNQHPVEGWNMYRISNGRIEQIGLSWLKHGFFAASQPGCGDCDIRQSGQRMGPGCQDVYDAEINAYQPALGPRWQVNAATGAFAYPPASPGGPSGNAVYKLCRATDTDLSVANATYLVEGQIVHPQDAAARHSLNNNSSRRVTINPATFEATLEDDTRVNTPAIYFWRDHANGTNQPDHDILYDVIDIVNDGRLIVASRVVNLGPARWRYEYAIQNLTSDRAAASLTVPVWRGAMPSNFGFHDVAYHSGEPYNTFDWVPTRDGIGWGWSMIETFQSNPNANALRWGTMYSFWFESCIGPAQGYAQVRLFKPPAPPTPDRPIEPAAVYPLVWSPDGSPSPCPADVDDGLGEGCPDSGVTVDDLLFYLLMFAQGDLGGDMDDGSGSGRPDGGVTIEDLLYYLEHFAAGC
jgi:hypothetical protein